jgi:hypothetical protein
MSKTVISSFGTFTDKELAFLKGGMKELSDVFTMQEAQRDTVKEIINRVHEELKIPKKIIRKMANTWHKSNYNEVVAEQQEFEALYESVITDNQ